MANRMDPIRQLAGPGPASYSTVERTTLFQPSTRIQVPSFGKSGRLKLPEKGKDSPGPGNYEYGHGRDDIDTQLAAAVKKKLGTSVFKSRRRRFAKKPQVGNVGPGQYSTPKSMFKAKPVHPTPNFKGTFGTRKRMGMLEFMKFAGQTTEAPAPGTYNAVDIPPVPKKRRGLQATASSGTGSSSPRSRASRRSKRSMRSTRSARDMDEDELYGASNTIFRKSSKLRPRPKLKDPGVAVGSYSKTSTFARAASVGGGLIERMSETRNVFSATVDKDALVIPDLDLSSTRLSSTLSKTQLGDTLPPSTRGGETLNTSLLPAVAPRVLLSRESPNPAGLFDPVAHHRLSLRTPASGSPSNRRGSAFGADEDGAAGAPTPSRRRKGKRRRSRGRDSDAPKGAARDTTTPSSGTLPSVSQRSHPGAGTGSRPASRSEQSAALPAVPSASSLLGKPGDGDTARSGTDEALPSLSPSAADRASNKHVADRPADHTTRPPVAPAVERKESGPPEAGDAMGMPRGPRRSSASTWDTPGGGGGVPAVAPGDASQTGSAPGTDNLGFDPRGSARVAPLGSVSRGATPPASVAPPPRPLAAAPPDPGATDTAAAADVTTPGADDDSSSYDSDEMFDVDPDEKLPGHDILATSQHVQSPVAATPAAPAGGAGAASAADPVAPPSAPPPSAPAAATASEAGEASDDEGYGSDEFDDENGE